MKKIFLVLFLLTFFISYSIEKKHEIFAREVLQKNDGFASAEGGTTGGSKASKSNVFQVKNKTELKNALGDKNNTIDKIIIISGTIDFNKDDNGKAFTEKDYAVDGYNFEEYLQTYSPEKWGKQKVTGELEDKRKLSQKNQQKDILLEIPGNTTIVGVNNAKLIGASLFIASDNAIIRNITFVAPTDLFPGWDPTDGSEGNWNSQYDSITIKGGTHIWIDHCHFLDGNEKSKIYFGRKYEQRDGLIDITNKSNFVTLSYNILENHDKTMLIGSSDSRLDDEGKLSVTIHHNYFYNLGQRVPRVRFGKVHVYNNYYKNDKKNTDYGYSLGVGKNSKIYAENNVIELDNNDYTTFVKIWGGEQLTTVNNLFNNKKIDKFTDKLSEVEWKPELYLKIDNVDKVKENVLKNAGIMKK